jgi:hypothetical protein
MNTISFKIGEESLLEKIFSSTVLLAYKEMLMVCQNHNSASPAWCSIDETFICNYVGNNTEFKNTIKFILSSYRWFTLVRRYRLPVASESKLTAFLSGLSEKYNCSTFDIEELKVSISNCERLELDKIYRLGEEIAWRRFNEDTAFAVEAIKSRNMIFSLIEYLRCGK